MKSYEKINKLIDDIENEEDSDQYKTKIIASLDDLNDKQIIDKDKELTNTHPLKEETKKQEIRDNKKESKLPKKDKKIIILLSILIIVALLSIVLAIIVPNSRNLTKQKNDDEIISKEKYESVIYNYGEAVTLAVKNYIAGNKKTPNFSDIENEIYYPNYNVICNKTIINYDGSIYLKDCEIKGYDNKYKYEYGILKETPKKSEKEIYIYHAVYDETNTDYYYSTNEKYDLDTDNKKIVDTYSCTSIECIGYASFANKNQEVVIYDGEYYLYNPSTKNKTILNNIGNKKYKDVEIILDNNNHVFALFIRNENDLGAFYLVNKKKIITDFEYNAQTTTKTLISKGYLAANIYKNKQMNVYLINQLTGEKSKKFEDIYSISEEQVGNTVLYYVSSSYLGERRGYYLKESFEKLVPDMDNYFSAINTNETISLINGNKYMVYNTSGDKIFESKNYDNLLKVVKDYVIVQEKDDIKLLDTSSKFIAVLFTMKSSYVFHPTISGWYEENGKNGIYFVVEDKSVDEGVEGRGLEFYYLPENGESGVIKTTEISGYVKP